MAKNDTDTDLQEDNREPQTPFGGWASARPRNDDDGPSGPKAVITSDDGSQRAASPEELTTPKYSAAQTATPKPAEPAIRSFSATFGVALPPAPGAAAPKAEEAKPAAQPAPAPAAGAMTFAGTPHLVQFAAVKDTQLFAPSGVQEALPDSPSLPQPSPEPDPFAWSPEEVPVASAEPRRQVAGDSWIGAVDTNYGAAPSPFVEPQQSAPAPEPEPETPIVNPFISGQPAWQAPSLEDFTASQPEPESEEEKEQAEEESHADEAGQVAPSPFNFVAYNAQQAEAAEQTGATGLATNMDSRPEPQNESLPAADSISSSSLFDEKPLFDEAPLSTGMPLPAAQADTPSDNPFANPFMRQAEPAASEQSFLLPEPDQPIPQANGIFAPANLDANTQTPFTESMLPVEGASPETLEEPASSQDIFSTANIQAATEPQPLPESPFFAPPSQTMEAPASEMPASVTPETDIFAPAAAIPADTDAGAEPQPLPESPFFAQPAETAATPAPVVPATDIFAPVNESQEVTQNTPSPIFTETPVQEFPTPAEPIAQPDGIFAEAELEMDITQTEQEGGFPEHHSDVAEVDAAPMQANVLAEDYLPETQPAADIPQDAIYADYATPQAQPFDDIPEQQEPIPAEEPAFNSTVSAVNLRHLTPDAIQHILQEHALWLSSGGRNGRRANFRNANLRGFNLSQSHLAEASLRGADLSGTNLSGSDLHGADLSEAFLSQADLRNANLTAAILTRVDMRTAAFEGAVMQGADLSGSSLAGAHLAGLDFGGAVMQDTDLNGANLSQANLSGTNLRGAHLIGANLSYASLHSANCRDVQFDGAILDYANLEGASLKNARMQGASLIGIDITAAEEASDEHRHESLQSERERLQQEWQKLQSLESQIQQLQAQMQQREMALQTDRSQVERAKRELRAEYEGMQQLMEKAHEVMARHRLHDRQFKYYGVTWFVFTILAFVSVMLFIKALEIASLDWLSIALVLGGCSLILGLFIATTVRSIKLSNNLKRLLDVYDQLFPRTDNSGQ